MSRKVTFAYNSKSRVYHFTCADPESFVRGGPIFDNVFLVDNEREDPNSTISGPSLARQRNANKMAFHWRADDGPTLNAGLADL